MTVTTVEDRDRAPSGEAGRARAWAAVCIAAASAFLYVADSAFVSLAIPQIEATFPSVPRARIGWVATAFMVTQASLLLIAGRLGDRRGRRRYFVLGLAAYGVGAAIAAVAPGLWWLLGARVVQGAGAALFAAGALALVLPLFPSARAAHVVGVWGLVGSVAGWLTPVLGSWLVGINWRWEFAVLAPAALVVAVMGMRLLPEPPPIDSPHRTDRVGLLLAPPAFGLAMLVLSQGSRWGWASARTLVLLAAVAVLLVAFVRRSFVAASPLLDISLLRIHGYRANIVAGVLQQASFFGWFLTAPLVMHNVWGWDGWHIAAGLFLSQITSSIGSPLTGPMVERMGGAVTVSLGAVLNALGAAGLVFVLPMTSGSFAAFIPCALLVGFGCSICGTATSGVALSYIPTHDLGAANSLQQLVRRMGGALGVAAAVGLLGEADGRDMLPGAQRAWALSAVLVALLIVPVMRARRAPVR